MCNDVIYVPALKESMLCFDSSCFTICSLNQKNRLSSPGAFQLNPEPQVTSRARSSLVKGCRSPKASAPTTTRTDVLSRGAGEQVQHPKSLCY